MAPDPYLASLVASGARIDAQGRPESFGDSAAELDAALRGAVLADRSDCARIDASGRDLLDLLHRLSTQDLKELAGPLGRLTVLTTPKGRIIERLYVFVLGPRSTLLVGGRLPDTSGRILSHLARFTFAEDTGLADATPGTRQIALLGPAARAAAASAGLPAPEPLAWSRASVDGTEVLALGVDGDGGPGLSFVVAVDAAPAFWSQLAARLAPHGVRPAGDRALEARRVALGLPVAGKELTEEHNPLEAGLWDSVSFSKGCYVGQEVVARLRTYDKVSKRLVGLSSDDAAAPPEGTELARDERVVGVVTSSIAGPAGAVQALAFVKRDAANDGARLRTTSGVVTVHTFAGPGAPAAP